MSSPSLPHSKISTKVSVFTVIKFSQIPSQNRHLYESSFINSPVHSTTSTKKKQRQPLKRHWNIRDKEYSFPWNCTWTPNKITFVIWCLYICVSAEDGWSSLLEKLHSKIPKLIFFYFSFLPSPPFFSNNIMTPLPSCKSQMLLLLTGPGFNICFLFKPFTPLLNLEPA